MAADDGEDVVEIVCDAAREAADGFHLLGFAQLLLERGAKRDVLDDGDREVLVLRRGQRDLRLNDRPVTMNVASVEPRGGDELPFLDDVAHVSGVDDHRGAHAGELLAGVADQLLERAVRLRHHTAGGDRDAEAGRLEHRLEPALRQRSGALCTFDGVQEQPGPEDDENSDGGIRDHEDAEVGGAETVAGERVEEIAAGERQQRHAEEPQSPQRGVHGRSGCDDPCAGRAVQAGGAEEDVSPQPRCVGQWPYRRTLSERGNVVDEIGREDERDRHHHQGEGNRSPAALEEESRKQREQHDVACRVRQRDERGRAPTELEGGLEDDRPEHERGGDGDDSRVDDVAPVVILSARAQHRAEPDSE